MISKIRYALHSLAKRPEDRLLFDYQRVLAGNFGYKDSEHLMAVEVFMQDYYKAAKTISRFNEICLQIFDQKINARRFMAKKNINKKKITEIDSQNKLKKLRITFKIDDRKHHKPGWKFAEYEMKGIPLRIAIGPRDLETKDVLGGNQYYTGSVELRFPIGLPNELGLKASIFSDVGSLSGLDQNSSQIEDSSALRASVGMGLSWATGIFIILLDCGSAMVK